MFDLYAFESGVSHTGIPVHVKKLPWANGWVQVRVIIKVGARHDPIGKEGLAHFFEHMPFAGTENFPSEDEIQELTNSLMLGELNAHTGCDDTTFEGKCFIENIDEALSLLVDMIFRANLSERHFFRERDGVIIEEIRDGLPNAVIAEFARRCNRNVYGDHPYGRSDSAAGWEESVACITPDDLVVFRRDNYVTSNIEVVLAGHIDLSQGLKAVNKAFSSDLPVGKPLGRPLPVLSWPLPLKTRTEISVSEAFGTTEAVTNKIKFVGQRPLPKDISPELIRLALSVVTDRVYDQLRLVDGAVYSVSCSVLEHADHVGVSFDVESNVKIGYKPIDLFHEHLEGFASGQTMSAKFDQLRNSWLLQMKTEEATSQGLVEAAITSLSVRGRIATSADKRNAFLATSFASAQDAVRAFFSRESVHWAITRP